MHTFRLIFEREPDTNWEVRISGTVEAKTLYQAFDRVHSSLGGRLWDVANGGAGEEWTVHVLQADGCWLWARECADCTGGGCETCAGDGFVYAEPHNCLPEDEVPA